MREKEKESEREKEQEEKKARTIFSNRFTGDVYIEINKSSYIFVRIFFRETPGEQIYM